MAEVKRLEIDLGDFAQGSFVEWFVANQPDESDAVLDRLASIPYVEFLRIT
jgi:ferritin